MMAKKPAKQVPIAKKATAKPARPAVKKPAKKPAKFEPILKVEWSDVDMCFVGSIPGIRGRCCHGSNTGDVYDQLVEIVLWLDHDSRVALIAKLDYRSIRRD